MDPIVINQKLESIRRCLVRINEKSPETVAKLTNDPNLQDIIVLKLTRAIQLCVDIASHVISSSTEIAPNTVGETFSV